MARTRKKSTTLAGRDTYHVIGPEGELAVKGPAGPVAPGALALVVAQRHATTATEPVVLTVERQSLFGPAAPIYRVTRTVEGVVHTAHIE